jgi:hypothetical protein
MFYREKKIECGNRYEEVDIIPRTVAAERGAGRGHRAKKQKESAPKQRNLNDKNAKRYLLQLANGNFGANDLHVSCTYQNEFLPKTPQEAEKEVRNYLRRIDYRRKKKGLDPVKYILVTEFKLDENGEYLKRLHHHIIMNGGLSRDEIESIWSKRVKGHGVQSMGWVNADRLQLGHNGIEALTRYITKDPQGRKRWSSSRNLKRPVSRTNDFKYSIIKIAKLAKHQDTAWTTLEQMYPRYQIVDVKFQYYEMTGWHIYLSMWLKPEFTRR